MFYEICHPMKSINKHMKTLRRGYNETAHNALQFFRNEDWTVPAEFDQLLVQYGKVDSK